MLMALVIGFILKCVVGQAGDTRVRFKPFCTSMKIYMLLLTLAISLRCAAVFFVGGLALEAFVQHDFPVQCCFVLAIVSSLMLPVYLT